MANTGNPPRGGAADDGIAADADHQLYRHLGRAEVPRGAEPAIRLFSLPQTRLGVSAAVLAVLWRQRRWVGVAAPVAGALAASAMANGLKQTICRRRPSREQIPPSRHLDDKETTGSLPSSHAATSVAFAVAAMHVFPPVGAVSIPIAGLVAFSRVFVGDHYPGDVAAGAALGAAVGTVAAVLANRAAQ